MDVFLNMIRLSDDELFAKMIVINYEKKDNTLSGDLVKVGGDNMLPEGWEVCSKHGYVEECYVCKLLSEGR